MGAILRYKFIGAIGSYLLLVYQLWKPHHQIVTATQTKAQTTK